MSARGRALVFVVAIVTACQSATPSQPPAASATAGAPQSGSAPPASSLDASPSGTPAASTGYRTVADLPEAPTAVRVRGLRQPGTIAVADGIAWTGTDLGVLGIDVATGEAVHAVDVGPGTAVAAGPVGVWASSYVTDLVSSIDPARGTVRQTIDVPRPTGLAVGDGVVWVTSPAASTVSMIDAATGEVSRTVQVEDAYGVAAGDGAAWVIGGTGLTRIDAADGSTEAIELAAGYQPVTVAPGPEAVWIGATRGGTFGALLRLDVASGEISTIQLRFGASPLPVTGVAIDGESVLATAVVDFSSHAGLTAVPGVLFRVEPDSGTITDQWRLPPGPVTLSVAEGLAWTTAGHSELVAARVDGGTAGAIDTEAPALAGITVANGIPYTPEVRCGASPCAPVLDVLGRGDGVDTPTVVLLHGGPDRFDARHYLGGLAATLAARGNVVVVATYRSEATGNDRETAIADTRCVVAWVRENVQDYGGDPERVALVGHSYGGDLTLDVALTGGEAPEDCLATGPTRPHLAIPMAGFRSRVTPADAPDGTPPLRLLVGAEDPVRGSGQTMVDALVEAGMDATFEEFPDIDHGEIVDPASSVPTVGRLVELVDTLGE